MHYRQRIRDAVAQRLRAANTMAAANVFTSRARPVLEILQRREAVLSVYTGDETSEDNPDGHYRVRTLTVSIEGMTGGGDSLDDTLDMLAKQVEDVIEFNDTLDNLLSMPLELRSTTVEITARGNQQVGAFRMDFECQYITEFVVNPDDAMWPQRQLPSQVFIRPTPTPQAYVQNGTPIVPATIDRSVVAPSQQPETPPNVCRDGVCAPPAWQGDPA